jgi:GntR family transcriptional regulator/MocR family aminotransferase
MSRQRIVPDWISLKRRSSMPLYRQISDAILTAIVDGRFPPGAYLPSSRVLAGDLGISRVTVYTAYELLVAERLLETREGSGTRVSPDFGMHAQQDTDERRRPFLAPKAHDDQSPVFLLPTETPVLQFQPGIPAFDTFPRQIWSRLLRRHGLRADPAMLDYGHAGGYGLLRDMIARHVIAARGLACVAKQVIVVTSSRAAISLACSILAKSGDKAIVGDPGYNTSRLCIERMGLKTVPIPVDDDGLKVSKLTSSECDARILYVTPTHHWPTGVSLSPARRHILLKWAKERDAWILEDDYDSEFHFDGPAPLPLQRDDAGERVIFLGTFSKALVPSIRCAYLVVPKALAETFEEQSALMGVEPALHVQAALADFIKDGSFAHYIQNMRKVYRRRRDKLERALANSLAGTIRVRHPAGGLQLVADLPDHILADEVGERGARINMCLRPMSVYSVNGSPVNALHLGFAPVPEPDIAPAVRRLADLIDTL